MATGVPLTRVDALSARWCKTYPPGVASISACWRATAGSPKMPISARSSSPSRQRRMSEQVDATLLAAALNLDPRAAQDLLDQGQAQTQPRPQDHDPQGLAQVECDRASATRSHSNRKPPTNPPRPPPIRP